MVDGVTHVHVLRLSVVILQRRSLFVVEAKEIRPYVFRGSAERDGPLGLPWLVLVWWDRRVIKESFYRAKARLTFSAVPMEFARWLSLKLKLLLCASKPRLVSSRQLTISVSPRITF